MNNTEFRAQVAAEIVRNDARIDNNSQQRVVSRTPMARSAQEALIMVRAATRGETGQR